MIPDSLLRRVERRQAQLNLAGLTEAEAWELAIGAEVIDRVKEWAGERSLEVTARPTYHGGSLRAIRLIVVKLGRREQMALKHWLAMA